MDTKQYKFVGKDFDIEAAQPKSMAITMKT